jgi:hypothetical protein
MSDLAFAQEVKVMTGPDFMVDWPKLVGQRVQITGGRVTAATEKDAYLLLPGGLVFLEPPWAEREDLRYLFHNCTDLVSDDSACTMTVTGNVEKRPSTGGPKLTDVKFTLPQ